MTEKDNLDTSGQEPVTDVTDMDVLLREITELFNDINWEELAKDQEPRS